MTTGYVIPLDPQELAQRRAYDPRDEIIDELDGVQDVSVEEAEELFSANDYQTKVAPLLELLPPYEADLLELYFTRGKRQCDIAVIFGVTQAAVSYRLDRAIKRLVFMANMPVFDEHELRRDLEGVVRNGVLLPLDVDILATMHSTTCQTETADKLRITQGRVRHRFLKAVDKLKVLAATDDTFDPYVRFFEALSHKGYNIMRAIVLPQWHDPNYRLPSSLDPLGTRRHMRAATKQDAQRRHTKRSVPRYSGRTPK